MNHVDVMPLDRRSMALVRGSFELLRPRGAVLMERFYDHLFSHYPYIRPLFKDHEMGQQRLAFMGVLSFLVQSGDDEAARQALAALGARHAGLGVAAGHYPAVAESLIHAAAAISGDLWTPEVHQAWTDFLAFVMHAMIDLVKPLP